MEKNTDDDKPLIRKSELQQVAEVLIRHEVEFMVIGGQAETLMGSPRVTTDVGLCYKHTPENCHRLAAAARELNAKLRNVPADVPFLLDGKTLALGANFTFTTRVIDLDLLSWVEPIGDFAALIKTAQRYPVGGIDLAVIDLEDLIRIKQHINRPKDRDSLFQLLAIKRIREETGQR